MLNNTEKENEITYFARANFRGQMRKFGIKRDDRRRHMYLIGKTGMGKSVLMENMIISDIQNGNGVAVVDPHGDLVEKVIKFVPKERTNDVVYFNPADISHPMAFNILESVDEEHKHLVASGLMGVFTKMWANVWSARMEYIMNNCILGLLDYPGSTLLGIPRLLVDKKYRTKVVERMKDPVVKSFWVTEYANYNDKFRTEAISPIQNKVGQFLSNFVIRNIVGQSKSTIDLRDIMNNKKILLLNLSKGRIGEDNSSLLGSMMITKLQLAAMERINIPEDERKDFYLYVDEFQNFATEAFANILSEARKYRLNLIVGHQYIDQLVTKDSTAVRDAVFGNVGTIVCFRVGAKDAEFLEVEFDPVFLQKDLVNIDKWNFYIKLMIDGVASRPFSALGLPPVKPEQFGGLADLDALIKVSRERYARPRKEVEDKIVKWTGIDEMHKGAANGADINEDEARFRDRPARRYDDPRGEARRDPRREIRRDERGQNQTPQRASQQPVRQKFFREERKEEIKPISLEAALKATPVDFKGRPLRHEEPKAKSSTPAPAVAPEKSDKSPNLLSGFQG